MYLHKWEKLYCIKVFQCILFYPVVTLKLDFVFFIFSAVTSMVLTCLECPPLPLQFLPKIVVLLVLETNLLWGENKQTNIINE